jgi:GNAT superfamily N-acetyltransferase
MINGEKSMKYKIKQASLRDIGKVIDLATEMVIHSKSPFRDVDDSILKTVRRNDLNGLYQLLNNPDIRIYVAESLEGKFLGHVFVMKNYIASTTGENQGHIFDLSVLDEYQKMGIGENLMKVAEDFCAKSGMKYVCFNVTTSNEKAVRFYERIGYSEERKWMIKIIKPQEPGESKPDDDETTYGE